MMKGKLAFTELLSFEHHVEQIYQQLDFVIASNTPAKQTDFLCSNMRTAAKFFNTI